MSEARLEAAEDKGVDVFGFVARFAPLLFLIVADDAVRDH